jgi:hypothetical protein
MIPMNILNACTRNRLALERFANFVNEVINDGAKTFVDLCLADKKEMVAYLIDALDDKYEWLTESRNFDITLTKFLNLMIMYDSENKESFIEAIQDQAVEYFSDTLDEYIAQLAEQRKEAENEEYYQKYPFILDPEYQNGTDYRR